MPHRGSVTHIEPWALPIAAGLALSQLVISRDHSAANANAASHRVASTSSSNAFMSVRDSFSVKPSRTMTSSLSGITTTN